MALMRRRLRGALLRTALRPRSAVAMGCVVTLAALALLAGDYAWESWATDGLGLILGATGLALIAVGLGGRRPDWIDPDG